MKPGWKRVMRKTAIVVSVLVALHLGALYFLQPRLIYFPRHYRAEFARPKNLADLNYDTSQRRQRSVLVSPFTNMRDMGRRMVGWPLCLLCEHNFDNRARLAELAARANPPRVDIFHGTNDRSIPFWMGESLASAFPRMIALHAIR